MRIWPGIDMASNLDEGELTRVANSLGAVHFCGRYSPVYQVTAAEIAYLHRRGGALLCIDNEDQTGAGLGGNYDLGKEHGERAALRWKALGAPSGIAIYLDVEQSFYVSAAYLAGFADGCAAHGMVGGCYINSVAGNGHNASYIEARRLTSQPIPIFASEPQPYSIANRFHGEWYPSAPDGFLDSVAVWQYCINYGSSDLDNCTDHGLSLMWSGTPPAPPKPAAKHYAIGTICGLKVSPSHSADMAINPQGRKVDLELGDTVLPTGKTAKVGGEAWSEVKLPNSPVHGWILKSCIKEIA